MTPEELWIHTLLTEASPGQFWVHPHKNELYILVDGGMLQIVPSESNFHEMNEKELNDFIVKTLSV